jgi:hypothetical protein
MEWEDIQTHYYKTKHSQRSGKRWTMTLISKLWDVAWGLWDFRNAVYHKQSNHSLHDDTIALDQQVRELTHTLALTGLLSKDKHLETIPIERL